VRRWRATRGIAAFDRIRYRRNDACVFLYAFDLIELNGDDLRRDALVYERASSHPFSPRSAGHAVQPAYGI
jgi:hypothetical protein